jgi:hypothetical protein
MNTLAQYDTPFATEEWVEARIPASCLAPDCIADAGLIRQGGLHNMLPWFFGSLFGNRT